MVPLTVKLSDDQVAQMANDTLDAIKAFETKNGRPATWDEKLAITAEVQRTYGLDPRFLDKPYDPTVGMTTGIGEALLETAQNVIETTGNFVGSVANAVGGAAKETGKNYRQTLATAALLGVAFVVLYIIVNKKGN